jgi:hypothetical protein
MILHEQQHSQVTANNGSIAATIGVATINPTQLKNISYSSATTSKSRRNARSIAATFKCRG